MGRGVGSVGRGITLVAPRFPMDKPGMAVLGWGMKNDGELTKGTLAGVLASESRWRLLEELSKGGVFAVSELALAVGIRQATASGHMIKMKAAGIVVQGKGRLYTLAPGVLAEGGGREVRLGICTLRFGEDANLEL